MQFFTGRALAYIANGGAPGPRGFSKRRIVRKEFMQSAVKINPFAKGRLQRLTVFGGQHAAIRRQSKDDIIRLFRQALKGTLQA